MNDFSRRAFLESGAAFAAALGIDLPSTPDRPIPASQPAHQQTDAPDLVVVNGRMYTIDDAQPRAEAFAVRHGRFVAVGSNSDIRNLVRPGTEVIDAEGMTVVPGFIDAHTHPSTAGVNELQYVNVNVGSIAEILDRLRARAATTPRGEWVVGIMYDDTRLRDGRPILASDLDSALPDHPARVEHRGGHTGVYNSKAFEAAGITVGTPDPPGGMYYRADGKLTGKVAEHAKEPLERLIPNEATREMRQAGVTLMSEQMARSGLTSVHQTHGSMEDLVAFQDAYRAGEMRFRVYMLPSGVPWTGEQPCYRPLLNAGMRTGFGDEFLRIGAVKFGADGSASERTMRMSTPYVGRPNDYGILTMTQEEIHEAVEEAHRAGWQIGIHANGDVAIDFVLNAYERVQRMWPRADARHRIEHCSLVNPDLIRRIKAVGAIPTPFYSYVHFHGPKWFEYGDEKMKWMFAHRSFLDADIPVAPASDFWPGPFEPLMAIQSMVTRKDEDGREWGPNQKVTVDEALRICTQNGAHASFEEHDKGSITAGKLADFVILGEDPHEVHPDLLKHIPVVRTVLGGNTTHLA